LFVAALRSLCSLQCLSFFQLPVLATSMLSLSRGHMSELRVSAAAVSVEARRPGSAWECGGKDGHQGEPATDPPTTGASIACAHVSHPPHRNSAWSELQFAGPELSSSVCALQKLLRPCCRFIPRMQQLPKHSWPAFTDVCARRGGLRN
jgi:hypothetical protein